MTVNLADRGEHFARWHPEDVAIRAPGGDLQRGIARGMVARSTIGRNEAAIQFVHGNLLAWLDGADSGALAPVDQPYPRVYGNLVAEGTS